MLCGEDGERIADPINLSFFKEGIESIRSVDPLDLYMLEAFFVGVPEVGISGEFEPRFFNFLEQIGSIEPLGFSLGSKQGEEEGLREFVQELGISLFEFDAECFWVDCANADIA